MTAKEYLESIRTLDADINRKLEQLSALRDVACNTTSYLTPAPGGTHDPKRKESLLSKIVDTEVEINDMVDTLADMKATAIDMIYRMENTVHCRILEYRYVRFHTWETVAGIVGITTRSVYKAASNALNEFTMIYEKAVSEGHAEDSMMPSCEHKG